MKLNEFDQLKSKIFSGDSMRSDVLRRDALIAVLSPAAPPVPGRNTYPNCVPWSILKLCVFDSESVGVQARFSPSERVRVVRFRFGKS